uniref:Uncharacterized protein n=1 Tax=Triticum urartu TaxID=4572 RepID=A0A8R7U174_TRIUA
MYEGSEVRHASLLAVSNPNVISPSSEGRRCQRGCGGEQGRDGSVKGVEAGSLAAASLLLVFDSVKKIDVEMDACCRRSRGVL